MANQKTRQQRRAQERERGERLHSRPTSSRKPLLMAVGGVIGIIAVIAALVGVKLAQDGSYSTPSTTPAHPAAVAPAAVVQGRRHHPGGHVRHHRLPVGRRRPQAIPGTPITAGREAADRLRRRRLLPATAPRERWPLVTALSRFGTFTNLGATHSSSVDVFPNTPTFSFHGATLHEQVPRARHGRADHEPGAGQLRTRRSRRRRRSSSSLVAPKYDPNGTIPFIYLGSYASTSASYNPQILAGMTMQQIAAGVRETRSSPHRARRSWARANMLTAALCKQTERPAGERVLVVRRHRGGEAPAVVTERGGAVGCRRGCRAGHPRPGRRGPGRLDLPHDHPLHDHVQLACSTTGVDQLREGDHQPAVASSPACPSRCSASRSSSSARAVPARRRGARPRRPCATPGSPGWSAGVAMVVLARLRGALPDRRHLPVVHRRARDHACSSSRVVLVAEALARAGDVRRPARVISAPMTSPSDLDVALVGAGDGCSCCWRRSPWSST